MRSVGRLAHPFHALPHGTTTAQGRAREHGAGQLGLHGGELQAGAGQQHVFRIRVNHIACHCPRISHFPPFDLSQVELILARYPKNYKAAGIIPMLDLAQRQVR